MILRLAHRSGMTAGMSVALLLLTALSGCVVEETRPLPKVHAVQAKEEIPSEELLDVGVRIFDPGVPAEIENDEQAQQKAGIYPDVRRAEARYMAKLLRNTLETTAQWGAVRVIPANAEFIDVIVSGKIVRSTGKELELLISVRDATGRTWYADRKYESEADLGSYLSDAALEGARSVPERLLDHRQRHADFP